MAAMVAVSRCSAASAARLGVERSVFLAGEEAAGRLLAASTRPAPAPRRAMPASAALTTGQPPTITNSSLVATAASSPNKEQLIRDLMASGSSSSRYMKERPSIVAVGLSVHTAPVELREKLAVPEAEWPRAIAEMCAYPHIQEAAVLSTCNRMEVYAVALSWHRGVHEVIDWMSQTSGVPVAELRKHLFLLRDRDASTHIMRVSAGLDSLVLGEGQILAQVKQVYTVGQNVPGFGRNLTGLFKQALTAGKRVRSETSISAGAVSVSSAAVELAALKASITGSVVSIVGAGKMSRLLVKHLISKNCTKCILLNRSRERADMLAADFPDMEVEYRPLTDLMHCVENSDITFWSTASDQPLVSKAHMTNMAQRMRHFVDISVPRNVDSDVAEVEGARVYNVDDLKEVVAANKEERRRRAQEAEGLIAEELATFEAWRDSLETVPTIKALRAKAESIRAAELEKLVAKLGDRVAAKDRKAVEEFSKALINKMLHGPMACLRSDGSDARTVHETLINMQALERMFDLQPTPLSAESRSR
eukprot:jgi/Chlat1/6375/Chrsp44S05833